MRLAALWIRLNALVVTDITVFVEFLNDYTYIIAQKKPFVKQKSISDNTKRKFFIL